MPGERFTPEEAIEGEIGDKVGDDREFSGDEMGEGVASSDPAVVGEASPADEPVNLQPVAKTVPPKRSLAERWRRNLLAARLRHFRKVDFGNKGPSINVRGREFNIANSNLEYFNVSHGIDLSKEVNRRWEKKRNHEPIRILDVGTANSTVLEEIKKRLGRKVECHSVDIKPYPEKKGVDQHITHAEALSRKFPPGYFDIVIDTRGGMMYASDRQQAIDEYYAILAPGGKAYFQPMPDQMRAPWGKSWLDDWADKSGATINRERKIELNVEKPREEKKEKGE